MPTTMRMLPVRTSEALRALITRAGPMNAATRALILLGAHAAGLDLRGLERELALALTGELDPRVHAALMDVISGAAQRGWPRSASSERGGELPESDDPFAGIGVEV